MKKLSLIEYLLIFFIFIAFSIIFFIKTSYKNIDTYSVKVNIITSLKLLDKDLKYFSTYKGKFENYDEINNKIQSFENNLKKLNTVLRKEKYINKVKKLKSDFTREKNFLEHVKTYNSQIIYVINYLHSLMKTIRKEESLSFTQMTQLSNTLFAIINYHSNHLYSYRDIKKKLNEIKNLATNSKKYVKYFYDNAKKITNQITIIEKERQKVEELKIYDQLVILQNYLERDFNLFISSSKFVAITLSLVAIVLLSILLYLQIKSLSKKKELIAYKYAIENSDNSIIVTDL